MTDPEDLLIALYYRVQHASRSFDRVPSGSRLMTQLEGSVRMVMYSDYEWQPISRQVTLRCTRGVRTVLDWLGESFISDFAMDKIEDDLCGLVNEVLDVHYGDCACVWDLEWEPHELVAHNSIEIERRRKWQPLPL